MNIQCFHYIHPHRVCVNKNFIINNHLTIKPVKYGICYSNKNFYLMHTKLAFISVSILYVCFIYIN